MGRFRIGMHPLGKIPPIHDGVPDYFRLPVMFSLVNLLTDFSHSALFHLESRLSCSPSLQHLTFIRPDEINPDNVVLASRLPGTGSIRCSFPAALISNAVLRRQLDREIERFLALCVSDQETPEPATPTEERQAVAVLQ